MDNIPKHNFSCSYDEYPIDQDILKQAESYNFKYHSHGKVPQPTTYLTPQTINVSEPQALQF